MTNQDLVTACVVALVDGLAGPRRNGEKPRRAPQYTFETDLGVDFNDVNRKAEGDD